MDVRVGLWRKLSTEELMLLNCGVGEDSPWTARRYNQSILKEISLEYSLEGLMLKLKLQYFGHLMWRTDSLEKTLMLGKIEGRRRGWQRMRISLTQWTGRPGVLRFMVLPRIGHDWVTGLNWPEDLMLLKCGVREDSWESLGLQECNQSIPQEISPEYSLEGLML